MISRTAFILVICVNLMVMPAMADRLSADWQVQRDFYNDMVDRICAGDRAALENLRTDALDGAEPVALSNLGWVHSNLEWCAGADVTPNYELVRFAYRESANAYYPVAMFNYGRMLFYGNYGAQISRGDGLSWLELSAQEGMARAAEELALIYAEGRGGVEKSIQAAEAYAGRAERLGLPERRIATLADTIRIAAETGSASVQPQPESSLAITSSTEAEIYRVSMEARNQNNSPRLADTLPFGNVYAQEMIYIAQAFDIGDVCWRVSGHFLLGERLVPGSDFTPRIFSDLLGQSAQDRQGSIGLGHRVSHFADLSDGIQFHMANPRFVGSNLTPYVYTLAEAQAQGPRCSNDDLEILYPEPVSANGY